MESADHADRPSDIQVTYAWNWFQYHPGQRLTAFNFFLVVLGAVLVGYATAVSDDSRALGAVVGLLGTVVSAAFWALDVRNAELVRCGQTALRELEVRLGMSIVAQNEQRTHLLDVLNGPIEAPIRRFMRPAQRRYLVTHTFWLRTVLLLAGVLSAAACIWALAGFPLQAHHATAVRLCRSC